MKPVLVFDMDGVLVEVSESYRETICQTVLHFTGKTVTREDVQEYKNRGGFNNDWLLSQVMARDLGVEVAYPDVINHFNSIFFGDIVDGVATGLMAREQWVPRNGLLEQLERTHHLAIFTGRLKEEAQMTLRRFAPAMTFDPLIGADEVIRGKPAPDGLHKVRDQFPGANLIYVGDTVDDARSSRAAGVPFVGIAAPGMSQRERLLELFAGEKAAHVIENINELPEVLGK
jgi:HAD superfamily phosphatase